MRLSRPPSEAARRRPRAGLALLVLLAHLALLIGWRSALRPAASAAAPPPQRSLVWVLTPRQPVTPAAPSARAERPASPRSATPQAARPAAAPETVAVGTLLSVAAEPSAPAAAPAAPASAASAPRERLLDSAATRAALRDIARQPLLSERAAASQEQALVSGAARLAQAASAAGRGDCNKGEFAGGGAGLLSLPFYVVAQARGQCAR